jgi:hypothetical protein
MRTQAQAWTVLLALSFPSGIRAQDSDPDSIPTRRSFIDVPLEIPHDPFGLGLKNTAYSVGLKIAEVFDDNVFLSSSDEERDTITVILLTADLRFKREETEAHVSYGGRERIYAKNSDLTGMEHFFDASGTMKVSNLRVEAGVEFRDRKDTFDVLEIREPVDTRYDREYVRVGADFNKLDVSVTGEMSHFHLDDDFHDRGDYTRVGVSLIGAARLWPQAEAFGEIRHRSTDYDEGVFSDFSYIRATVGARGAFTPTFRGEGRIGYGRTQTDDEGLLGSADFSGVVIEGLAAWEMSDKHRFEVGVFYEPSESVVTGLGVHGGVRAGWRFRFDERWSFRTSARWVRETDPDGDFERTGVHWRVGARWDSGDRFFADAGVLYRSAMADDSTLEYDNLRFSIGMGVEW